MSPPEQIPHPQADAKGRGHARVPRRHQALPGPGRSPRWTSSRWRSRPGEICVLVGPSGCGKTTAMRMVNRMIDITERRHPARRRAASHERAPAELRREIGYAIQQIGLFPHLTVGENIATVPQPARLGQGAHPRARRRAAGAGVARPGRDARPLPRPALGRPAPARRRGARPGGRPAADADGRAVRRDRPDQPRAAPERVPAPPAGDPQDDRVRDPRHRRGDQDGRPDRGAAEGRQARPVRAARPSC